jgi:mono/diheme cytochrome c family protein
MKIGRQWRLRIGWGAVALLLVLVTVVVWLNVRDEEPLSASNRPFTADAAMVEHGAYLARAGNCIGCHTARSGAEYAGGRSIETPFGIVNAPNITPDRQTGIGDWTDGDFWRAMHNGRSKDGRLLYPAFPYPNFTQVTRGDSDAIYAYLRSLPPVAQPNKPHELAFPYNLQVSLAVWRALYFSPGVYEPRQDKSPEWNRGAYLVRGLGHCVACHARRNLLGASSEKRELSGGLIPAQNWYAPSLVSEHEAGVAGWETQQVVDVLKTGISERRAVMGPMAEVVFRSTQYLSDSDLHAMAHFLRDLGQGEPAQARKADPAQRVLGQKVYVDNCAKCHGDEGQGAPGAYPGLAGNRAVTMTAATNVIHAILSGGFAPTTVGNPRPYGMPPFSQSLSDAEVAAVATYIRSAWGNEAPPVSQVDVLHMRGGGSR